MKHFPRLIELLVSNIKDGNVLKRLYEIHYQPIYLRKLLSYTVRITDFNEEDLFDMKNVANVLQYHFNRIITGIHRKISFKQTFTKHFQIKIVEYVEATFFINFSKPCPIIVNLDGKV